MNPAVVEASRKLGLLGSLYFSQGLPFGFFTQALPVLLRQQGVSLEGIGLTSLLAMPWALKFLWAPLVDRYPRTSARRRKAWILPLQLVAAAIPAGLALVHGSDSLIVLAIVVFALNLVAATQDIATDGLAVDLLAPAERGLANGLQVAGYRLGMIVGGGALLVVYDEHGSRIAFGAMALLTLAATVPVLMAREPSRSAAVALAPSRHFLRRPGSASVLVLIFAYKAGDAFATAMLRPFLVDSRLGLADVGWLLGTVGFVAGLFGALAGGALVNRLGRRTALVAFAFLQAASIVGYAYLASHAVSWSMLAVILGAEHFAGGMATAALFTCMMDWSSRETSATDYTVQASAVVIATGAASALAGYSAHAFGYFTHFCLAVGLALAAPLAVHLIYPAIEKARRWERASSEALPCA